MKSNARKAAVLGIMAAMVIVLGFLENMLPPLPLPLLPPNFRLGVSNIVVMYALIFIGKKAAVTLVFLKAMFNFLRGPMAGILSLSGGLLAVAAIIFFSRLFDIMDGLAQPTTVQKDANAAELEVCREDVKMGFPDRFIHNNKISYVAMGIIGAIFHNMGQLIMASFFLRDFRVMVFYLPILLITGVITGAGTGAGLGLLSTTAKFFARHRHYDN